MTPILDTNHKYPLVVEVTMYRHNWMDNKIINEVRRNARLSKINSSNSHFFVTTSDLKEILTKKFSEDIEEQAGLPQDKLVQSVTSAFFLHSVVNSFSNLKYVKFNVSSNKNYTRKSGDTVTFDYKILHARINLPELVENKTELKEFQELLTYINFWEYDKYNPKTFIEVSSRDLISNINYHEGEDSEFVKEFGEIINRLLTYVDLKLESDNTTIHLIIMD